MKQIFVQLLLLLSLGAWAQSEPTKVVVFDIKEEISPSATRITQKALEHAESVNADLVIVHMNTYGGYVTDADSIRTRILNTPVPTYVFIDNNAASAGALISLACDKIYMRPGGSIGAATVVNQSGEAAPDKYQSYMRKQMRSTAESHGFDTFIENGDTTLVYKRNPDIAEGMVDESVVVEGLDDSSKVITLTTEEALKWGFCEGKANSIEEILEINGIENYTIERVEKSSLDRVFSFFANPALRSILILMMIGGIYFELQSPGIGFALAIAVLAAVAYFAPLYLEGLAANWEIVLFFIGLILIGLEVLVIPGFGIAGIGGIILMLFSLVVSMLNNIDYFDFSLTGVGALSNALTVVFISMVGFLTIVMVFGRRLLNSTLFQRLVLADTLEASKVQPHVESVDLSTLLDTEGTAHSALRPMGTVQVDGRSFQAKSLGEFIEKGEKVKVVRIESQVLIVVKL